MPNPKKEGSELSPEEFGKKGVVPGLPTCGKPKKSGDEASPEERSKDKEVMAPKRARGSNLASNDPRRLDD